MTTKQENMIDSTTEFEISWRWNTLFCRDLEKEKNNPLISTPSHGGVGESVSWFLIEKEIRRFNFTKIEDVPENKPGVFFSYSHSRKWMGSSSLNYEKGNVLGRI